MNRRAEETLEQYVQRRQRRERLWEAAYVAVFVVQIAFGVVSYFCGWWP